MKVIEKKDEIMKRTKRVIVIMVAISLLFGCSSEKNKLPPDTEDQIVIKVDPTVELFSLIHHLAGDKQYTENLLPVFIEDVEEYFGQLKDHQAIVFARESNIRHQINGDAPMSLAVYIGTPPLLEPKFDLSNLPEGFDPRWDSALISEYLENARKFAVESNFMEFFNNHAELNDLTIKNLEKLMNKKTFSSGTTISLVIFPTILLSI